MTFAFSPRRTFVGILGGFLALTLGLSAASDRKFTTPPALSTEVKTLVGLLAQAHYNRDSVKNSDFEQVIPDFMAELDSQHLFFINSDKAAFARGYGTKVYDNAAYLGNIDAAYEIFATYETRTQNRISWILEELKKDIDLGINGTYRADRTKSDWPATAAAADDLWRDRLKFELIAEMLNKKSVDDAKQTIRKRYERMLKNLTEIEGDDLAEIFLSCVARLYDPHSNYLSAKSYEDFTIQMKLSLFGIGALLGVEDDNCFVKEIVPGGPADLGRQLKPQDKIISVAQIGGEPVEVMGMKIRKIVDMIRGAKDTKVRLIVQPADATDPSARREIVITRDVVKLNSARAHAAIFQVPNAADGVLKPVGVITLPTFYGPAEDGDTDASEKSGTTEDVARLIDQLTKAGISSLVLDLRHNGGGYLTEAIDLTGLFISKGPVVQVKSYSGDIQVDRDNSDKIAYRGPLAVLVDRFSASASEIVTGALQNYGRAIVIGDSSTHGKGTVQTVVEIKNVLGPRLSPSIAKSGAAKITIQKFYLPGGASTQLKGVVPDIVLPSINEYLPIGESPLPHALVWDQIPSSSFDGAPLDAKILTSLRQASLERQTKLEEFAFLKKNIEWFKGRQEQKQYSLNLEERKRQKLEDDAFRKSSKGERDLLAKGDFTFKEYRLGPPLPPKIKAPKKTGDLTDGEDDENDLGVDEDNDAYAKVDIHLRETLRVLSDAVALAANRDFWVSNHPPLTAAGKG